MKLAFLFRKYHKWLALLIGIQALIWCVSGVYMTVVHIDIVRGNHLVKTSQPEDLSKLSGKIIDLPELKAVDRVSSAYLTAVNGRPVYIIENHRKRIRIDATTGDPLPDVDERFIRDQALRLFTGDANIESVNLLESYPRELGGRVSPIWRVQFDDWLASTLYFLPDTGELRSKRSDLWRVFDFFWMLHIMDYETREEVNHNLLRIAASIGLVLSLSGIVMLFYSFKHDHTNQSNLVSKFKTVHKWIGLVLGVQLVIWMASGLMFSLLSQKEVSGRYLLNSSQNYDLDFSQVSFQSVLDNGRGLSSIKSYQLAGQKLLIVESIDGSKKIVDAKQNSIQRITEETARQIATSRFSGNQVIKSVFLETTKTTENRKFKLPLWRVNFSDEQNSSLYLSAETGQVFGAKTDTWRLFDIFWMLHIMDYSERDDMNNALVIFVALTTLFMASAGFVLLFYVFSARDFVWLKLNKKVHLLAKDFNGHQLEIETENNANLYQVLSSQQIELESVCGGGGTCGKCRIKIGPSADVSEADKNYLTEFEILQGIRLACQFSITKPLEVEIPDYTEIPMKTSQEAFSKQS